MAAPQGYSSLGVIGFTDQGTYDNSATYYINDLVHYLGNIYRCKVDETVGIAPAENVNWTVFVGAPTNIVEELIAPVEVNPSENAYSVGDQLIYNDILYKVTAAIAIGDSLTVGTNIALSDVVVDQFKTINNTLGNTDISGVGNSITAAISSLNNDFANISNPNLLDNSWFTVNQRGESSYSSLGYTVDRWKTQTWNLTSMVVTPQNPGILIEGTASSSNSCGIVQYIENPSSLVDKTLTLSCIATDSLGVGACLAQVFVDNTQIARISLQNASNALKKITFTMPSSASSMYIAIGQSGSYGGAGNTNLLIKAVKLEVGSVSTLAMDTAPNYASELAKCQRYFQRICSVNSAAYSFVGFGTLQTTQRARIWVPLPVTMRTQPSVTASGTFKLQNGDAIVSISTGTDAIVINNYTVSTNGLGLFVNSASAISTITVGSAVEFIVNGDTSAYIDLSADL